MPQLVTVRVDRPSRRPIRIWVPVLPVVLLFLPIVALVVLAAVVACLVFHLNVARSLGTAWRLVSALPGTRVDVAQGRTALLLTIR